ncbi:DUF6361 family protein [Kiritimatiellota bacterium B12222]|nr:DUF6361 family protein [Kiritimatiellota bacterium B12222]
MKSSLGWIDFSSEHRDRVRTVIDLLKAPGVVDELGIGVIRDAFSDTLFPGLSTIQTRPKYFIIVPRILKEYEGLTDRKRGRIPLRDHLAEQELACRVMLAKRYHEQEGLGIIGVTFGERTDTDVQRRPSSVYWNGLRAFGLVKSDGALADFYRRHSGHQPSIRLRLEEGRETMGDDFDAEDLDAGPVVAPPSVEDWMEDLAITLTKDEAVFLRQKVCACQPDSLIGQLLLDEDLADAVVDLGDSAAFTDLVALLEDRTFTHVQTLRVAQMARDFWRILYGAHLRYNVLLQARFGSEGRKSEYEEKWIAWRGEMATFDWGTWKDEDLWQLVSNHGGHPHPWTRTFINSWLDVSRQADASDSVFDNLVVNQETQNKRSRSRLRADNKGERVDGWLGIRNLEYRMPQVWQFVADIRRAERGEADPDVGL